MYKWILKISEYWTKGNIIGWPDICWPNQPKIFPFVQYSLLYMIWHILLYIFFKIKEFLWWTSVMILDLRVSFNMFCMIFFQSLLFWWRQVCVKIICLTQKKNLFKTYFTDARDRLTIFLLLRAIRSQQLILRKICSYINQIFKLSVVTVFNFFLLIKKSQKYAYFLLSLEKTA